MNSGSASGTRKAAIYYEGSARIARSWRTHVDNNGVRGKAAGGRTFQCIPSVVAESRPQNVWVGLLARRRRACSAAASLSPADGRVVERSSALTYTGGTAPDSRRPSLLCPSWAPKQGLRYTTTASTPQIYGLPGCDRADASR